MNSQNNSRVFRRFFKQVSPRRDLVLASREAPMTIETFIQYQWKRARNYQEQQNQTNPNRRFYAMMGAISTAYAWALWKSKSAESELLRVGAAGSLTMTVCDASLYSIESISARSKIVRGENVGFTEMTKRIL